MEIGHFQFSPVKFNYQKQKIGPVQLGPINLQNKLSNLENWTMQI